MTFPFYYPCRFILVWSFSSFETKHTFISDLSFSSSECLCSLFCELSSGNIYFASLPCRLLTAPSQGSTQPSCALQSSPALKENRFSGMPCVHMPVGAAGPTCRAGKPDPTAASPATFQPRKPFLSNCYLSNRSTRHLGLGQTCACSHETLNLQTFDLSVAPENPSIIFARADGDPKDDF